MKKVKDERQLLYEYLDSYDFVNTQEVYSAVADYFSNDGEKELSRGELNLCDALADRYMSDRDFNRDFDTGDFIK